MVDRVNKTVKALSSIRDPVNYSAAALKNAELCDRSADIHSENNHFFTAISLHIAVPLSENFSSYSVIILP